MINLMNERDAYLPRTTLDKLVEAVEKKYGSMTKAPASVVKIVQNYVKDSGMERFRHPRHHRSRKRDHYNHFKWIKVYHSNNKWYTNSESLSRMTRLVHWHTNLKIASELTAFPVYEYHKLTPSKDTVIYHYKGIRFKFNSYQKLVDMCSHMLDWSFAPQTIYQLKHHDYKGTVKTYHKYAVLNYRRK